MKGMWVGYDVGCTMGLTLGHGAWQIDQPSNGSMWNSYSFQPVGQWMGYSFTDLGAEGCSHSLNALSTHGVGLFLASHSRCLQEERSCGSASISCQTFLSPRTVSSQVFLGRPGPLVRGTLMDLHLLIQPLLHSTCPYQLRRFALNMFLVVRCWTFPSVLAC